MRTTTKKRSKREQRKKIKDTISIKMLHLSFYYNKCRTTLT